MLPDYKVTQADKLGNDPYGKIQLDELQQERKSINTNNIYQAKDDIWIYWSRKQ